MSYTPKGPFNDNSPMKPREVINPVMMADMAHMEVLFKGAFALSKQCYVENLWANTPLEHRLHVLGVLFNSADTLNKHIRQEHGQLWVRDTAKQKALRYCFLSIDDIGKSLAEALKTLASAYMRHQLNAPWYRPEDIDAHTKRLMHAANPPPKPRFL